MFRQTSISNLDDIEIFFVRVYKKIKLNGHDSDLSLLLKHASIIINRNASYYELTNSKHKKKKKN
jgi:hypothetical protein